MGGIPSRLEEALLFGDRLLAHPTVHRFQPGTGHWPIFASLCRSAQAKGKLAADAWFAALAMDDGLDQGFRHPESRVAEPLDGVIEIQNSHFGRIGEEAHYKKGRGTGMTAFHLHGFRFSDSTKKARQEVELVVGGGVFG